MASLTDMSYAEIDLAIVPAAPPTRKNIGPPLAPPRSPRTGPVPPGVQVDAKCLLMRVLADAHCLKNHRTSSFNWHRFGSVIEMRLLSPQISGVCSADEHCVTERSAFSMAPCARPPPASRIPPSPSIGRPRQTMRCSFSEIPPSCGVLSVTIQDGGRLGRLRLAFPSLRPGGGIS